MTDIDKVYEELQTSDGPDRTAELDELRGYSEAWKDSSLPRQQGKIVDLQLERLRNGIVDPVFAALIKTLGEIEESEFSMLDAACASGYYGEVMRSANPGVDYTGTDYSEAMVEEAKRRYPDGDFRVENACDLSFPDGSFDCVMLSGAL